MSNGKKFMNKDNISAIVTAVAVVSLITGFGSILTFMVTHLILTPNKNNWKMQ